MKFLRNKNAPPLTGLVQEFIDTAYDTVKLVADNLDLITAVGEAIEAGTLDEFISAADIDTLAKLNAFVLDANIASEAYVDAAVAGLYDYKGGYNASTNTPDLTTSPNTILQADTYQVTDAGTFFTANMEPGDQLTAIIDNPTVEADWTILNRNIDSAAFATAAQGAKADTATQPADNISTLTNDSNYADDQTAQEIVDAFATIIPAVSQLEAETGTEALLRQWSPLRIAQAIAALGAAGIEEAPENGSPYSRQDAGWVLSAVAGNYAPAEGWDAITNGIGTTFNFVTASLSELTVAENVAASVYSVPDALGVSGNTLSLYNKGAGAVTVDVPGTDTLISIDNVCEQYQAITILKVAPTEWAVIGGSA